VIADRGEPVGPIRDGAAVVLFNFRGDRAIEISRAFEAEELPAFDRGRRPDIAFAGMMQYDGDAQIPARYLVLPPAIDRTLGEYLAHNGVSQLAVSETQKFGHVTYFWNGNQAQKFDAEAETYIEISSDRRPFEERPWMKAAEITDVVIDRLPEFRHARLNYANGDMVGHTGDRDATVIAVAAVDLCIGRLIRRIEELDGALIVTADHGNADEMFMRDKKGVIERDASGRPRPKTSHTLNPVPCHIYVPGHSSELALASVADAGLTNLAATTLMLLGYEAPDDYEPALVAVAGPAVR
jgi:2,3-bisphosphoglycerate-independent phosphoglycerate mutase